MLGAGVDLELGQLPPGQAVARQHALDGLPQDLRRAALDLLRERPLAQAPWITGVPVVDLVLTLLTRDGDLLGVDDDDEIARVDVRRVLGLALAAQRVCDPGR